MSLYKVQDVLHNMHISRHATSLVIMMLSDHPCELSQHNGYTPQPYTLVVTGTTVETHSLPAEQNDYWMSTQLLKQVTSRDIMITTELSQGQSRCTGLSKLHCKFRPASPALRLAVHEMRATSAPNLQPQAHASKAHCAGNQADALMQQSSSQKPDEPSISVTPGPCNLPTRRKMQGTTATAEKPCAVCIARLRYPTTPGF
jgi:hypothetical protein